MMDIGLPLMKPDIVVARIFYRLGLIPCEEFKKDSDAETVVRAREQFANATGHPIRYVDIVFVWLWAGEKIPTSDSCKESSWETSSSRAVAYAKSRASATISMW